MARDVLTELHGKLVGIDKDGALVIESGIIRTADGSAVSFPDGITGAVDGGAGGTSGQVQYNASGEFAGMSGTSWNNTTGALSISGKTVASYAPAISLQQTWNNASVAFEMLRIDVTDTTSDAQSAFISCATGGTTRFSVKKDGTITGVWTGTPITASYGGTGQSNYAVGDLLYASGTNVLSKLTVGQTNQVLTISSGVPAWKYSFIPQNSRSADYTLTASDAGGHVYHPSADTTARQWTIPNNSSVPFEIGTAITFVNDTSAGTVTIAMVSDTLVLAGAGTTGPRTLAAGGIATALKIGASRWIISGTGLT